MTQIKDKSLDDMHQSLTATRSRVLQADDHIKKLGEGAQKVLLGIDGAMLEINALMKQLFLCSQYDLNEYELLQGELVRHLSNLHQIVSSRFGKIKEETH